MEFRRPNDQRGFLHKSKLFGTITNLVGGVGAGISGVKSVIGSFKGGQPTVVPQTFRPVKKFADVVPGRHATDGAGPCRPGTVPDPQGRGFCVSPRSPLGVSAFGGGVVEGVYGPAFVPGSEIRDVAVCPPGFALGKDDLCYNGLANRNRKYPRGRRPLLTGGDMRAISRARRAGGRLATAKSDLVALGMLKPASPRRRKKKAVPCA